MQHTTVDDLARIQQVWPSFEQLVGLRGRKVYALIDTAQNSYPVAATTPADPHRPLVEFYRRRDQIDLWLPIPS